MPLDIQPHLDIEGVDVCDVLAAAGPLHLGLGGQVEEGVAVLPEGGPQDVHLRLLDVARPLVLNLEQSGTVILREQSR